MGIKKIFYLLFLLLFSCNNDDNSINNTEKILLYDFKIGNISTNSDYEIEIDINGDKSILKPPSLGFQKKITGDYKLKDSYINIKSKSKNSINIYYEVRNNLKIAHNGIIQNKGNFIAGGFFQNNLEKFIPKSDFNKKNIKQNEILTRVSFSFGSINNINKNIEIELEGKKIYILAPNDFEYLTTSQAKFLNIKVKYPLNNQKENYNGNVTIRKGDNFYKSINLTNSIDLNVNFDN